MIERVVIGFAAAGLVSVAAMRARSLSPAGATAATLLGTVAVAAGWDWGALLLLYFIVSSALSHMGAGPRGARTEPIVEKGGARDAVQVAANGGVFACAALAYAVNPSMAAMACGAGALAASAADTWGTEIGTRYGGTPWSVRTLAPAPAGTSGAVSVAGCLAAAAGAAFIAATARALGWPMSVCLSAMLGGIAGAAADTVIGATLQSGRYCPACATATERGIHDCGAVTRRARGIAWMTNDAVNLAATMVGGLLAWRCLR